MFHRIDLDALDHRSFVGVGGWKQETSNTSPLQHRHDRQYPSGSTQQSIECQLSDQRRIVRHRLLHHTRSHQHPDGDGKVEHAAFLADISRGQINGELFLRQTEASRLDRGLHPLLAFLDGAIWKPYDVELWQAIFSIGLDLDRKRGDAQNGGRVRFGVLHARTQGMVVTPHRAASPLLCDLSDHTSGK